MTTSLGSSGITFNDSSSKSTNNGTRTLVTTLTASNSTSLSVTNLSGYNHYELIFDSLAPVSAGTSFLQYYVNGAFGSSASSYLSGQLMTPSANYGGNYAAAYLCYPGYWLSGTTYPSSGLAGKITIYNASSTTLYKPCYGFTYGAGSSSTVNNLNSIGFIYV